MSAEGPSRRVERLLLAVAVLSTLVLSVRLWDQPDRTEALAERVQSLEQTVQQRGAPGSTAAASEDPLREQRIAASVVQALGPRLDQLSQGNHPPMGGPADRGPAKAELNADQATAAKEGGRLVDAAISRGRLDEADGAQLHDKLQALAGTAEGQALLARLFAAMNQGKLQVEMKNGHPSFMP